MDPKKARVRDKYECSLMGRKGVRVVWSICARNQNVHGVLTLHPMSLSLIVIGASAGGLHTVRELLAQLPGDLDAAVLLVIHTHPLSPGLMAQVLDQAGPFRVSYAAHQGSIQAGHAYIAPPNHHLIVEEGHMLVVKGPKENYHRPAVDPLFRSAAVHHGTHVIGVILTGYLNDGTSGARAVKQCGGRLIVQDPQDAQVPEMPESVLRHVAVDHCVAVEQMGSLLVELTQQPVRAALSPEQIALLKLEAGIAAMRDQEDEVVGRLGRRTTLTCPECHGLLWEIVDGKMLRYRCRVGHAYTADCLEKDQIEALEQSLYTALSSLGQSAALASSLAESARDPDSRHLFQDKAEGFSDAARQVRSLLAKPADC